MQRQTVENNVVLQSRRVCSYESMVIKNPASSGNVCRIVFFILYGSSINSFPEQPTKHI